MEVPFDGTHIASAVLMLLPTSRGCVTLASSNTQDDPNLDPNPLSTEVDRAMLREGTRRTLKAAETPYAKDILNGKTLPPAYPPLTSNSTDDEIVARVRRCACT